MPKKIIGNTTATPNPQPDWNQPNSAKADYIKNKPTTLNAFLEASEEDDGKIIEVVDGEYTLKDIKTSSVGAYVQEAIGSIGESKIEGLSVSYDATTNTLTFN